MNRALVLYRSLVIAILALAIGSVALADTEPGDVETNFLIGVTDGVGLVPGASIEVLGTDLPATLTDATGTARLALPLGQPVTLRVTDESGDFTLASVGLPPAGDGVEGGLYLMSGDGSKIILAGPEESDFAAYNAAVAAIGAEWDARQDDEETEAVTEPVHRRVSRRVSLASSPLARLGAARRGTGVLDETLSMGDQLVPADLATEDGAGQTQSADLDAGFGSIGRLPSNPMRVLAWGGESEPNNVVGQCNSIASADFGATLAGQAIGAVGDADFFCFTANCGDTITITITPSGTLRPRLDLNHYTNNTLITSSQSSVVPAVVTLTQAEAATYNFKVSGNTSTTGSYTISVARTAGTCLVDPFEPTWGTDESTMACAIPPAPGAQLIAPPAAPATFAQDRAVTWATQFGNKDTDTYCVNLDCGAGLTVTVTPLDSTFAPAIRFLAPVLVTSSSNQYSGSSAAAGVPLTSSISPAIQSGLWKVEISSSLGTKGRYNVAFSTFPAPYQCVDAYEPDNTRAQCTPIMTDGSRQSHILFPVWNGPAVGGTQEEDWFCFEVTECGSRVVVETYPTMPTVDLPEPSVTVYGPDGAAVDSQSSGGHRTIHAVVSFIAKVPGTYSAKVFCTGIPPYTNDSAGQYDMLVQVIDAKEPLVVPVTQTENPTETIVEAEALASVPDPAWLASVAPGPGAVDIGSLPGQTFGPQLNGNRYTTAVSLPFTFPFFGQPKTQVRISEGGYLTFRAASAGVTSPSCIPDTINNVEDAVYAFWTGLVGRRSQVTSPTQELVPNARVTAETLGAPGSREYVVTWSHMARAFSSVTTPMGDHNFSITLEEATGNIVCRYGLMQGHPGAQGQNATVGLENATGTAAVVYGCYQPRVHAGLVLTYVPDGAGSYTIVESEAPQNLVDYPTARSCNYDIAADFAPFEDIASSGTQITSGPTLGVNWSSYGPFPANPPNPNPVPAPLAATQLDEGWVSRAVPWASGVFPFHGTFQTNFNIHINGFLAFGPGTFNGTMIPTDNTRSNKCPLPQMAFMYGVVAPFWDDLFISPSGAYTGGFVFEQLDDPPGPNNARYIVQWSNALIQAPGSTAAATVNNFKLTFQLILHEDGRIEYRYGNMGGLTPHHMATGTGATVGVESPNAGAPYHGVMPSGTTYWCGTSNASAIDPSQGPLVRDRRVIFTPHVNAPPSFEWRDAATDALLGTGSTFVANDTTPCQLKLNVTARDPEQCCAVTSSQLVDVADRWAPVVTSAPVLGIDGSPCSFLWPPQHGYADLDLSRTGASGIVASDACGNGVVVEIASISSTQPEESVGDIGDGASYDDVMISPDRQSFSLRAERGGSCGNLDRSYTVTLQVRDSLGNAREVGSFPICVYHDMGHEPPGPYFSANPDSNQNDSRPGWIEGTYGVDCGPGCSRSCDPTQGP